MPRAYFPAWSPWHKASSASNVPGSASGLSSICRRSLALSRTTSPQAMTVPDESTQTGAPPKATSASLQAGVMPRDRRARAGLGTP